MRFFLLPLLLLSGFFLNTTLGHPVMKGTSDTAHFYMQHSYDVIKYSLDLDLYSCYTSPYPKSFTGVEIITIKIDSTLSGIKLNAVSTSLNIDSVSLNGDSFTHLNDTLTIQLDKTYLPGETADIKIYYHHTNVSDHGFYASGGYVFTDCPPEGARKWFPCWDRPSDKALWELYASVPLSVRLGSAGSLADSTVTGDTLVYHWISENPVSTYLITISSKVDFLKHVEFWKKPADPNDSIPVLIFYKSGENISTVSEVIAPLTDFYSEKFGDYPFEKIGFATLNSSFPWGGMENQTMVNLMPGGYGNEELIAHEHSHQWFGDLVTCGTWADIWLNEGFGTYCANLWIENEEGYDVYKNEMNILANQYLNNNPGWPIYHPSWAIHTPPGNQLYNEAISYNKGACVLHQLRYVLGDSLFFLVLKGYATDTNFMYKNAVTEDFVAKANQVSGLDLGWFFDEWVYAPNHPIYENLVGFVDSGAGWKVNLTINQIQTTTMFFTMPVQIGIEFIDGTDTMIQVINNSNSQFFEFLFTKQPVSLTFDPLRNILLKQASTIVGISDSPVLSTDDRLQAHPNPFTDRIKLTYNVESPGNVRISILDINGREMKTMVDRRHEPGTYQIILSEVSVLSPGMYIVKLESSGYQETKTIIKL